MLYLNNDAFHGRGEKFQALGPLRFLWGSDHATCSTLKQKTFEITRRSHPVRFFSINSQLTCFYIYKQSLRAIEVDAHIKAHDKCKALKISFHSNFLNTFILSSNWCSDFRLQLLLKNTLVVIIIILRRTKSAWPTQLSSPISKHAYRIISCHLAYLQWALLYIYFEEI